jgi:hypothetical protein
MAKYGCVIKKIPMGFTFRWMREETENLTRISNETLKM